jgi:hypothetical protein
MAREDDLWTGSYDLSANYTIAMSLLLEFCDYQQIFIRRDFTFLERFQIFSQRNYVEFVNVKQNLPLNVLLAFAVRDKRKLFQDHHRRRVIFTTMLQCTVFFNISFERDIHII